MSDLYLGHPLTIESRILDLDRIKLNKNYLRYVQL